MNTTLLVTGLACVIAATIGGGLKAFEIEFPVFPSLKRQLILGAFGAILIVVSFLISPITPSGLPPSANASSDPKTVTEPSGNENLKVSSETPAPSCTRRDSAGHCLTCSFLVTLQGKQAETVQFFTCPYMAEGKKEASFDGTVLIENYKGHYGLFVMRLQENRAPASLSQPEMLSWLQANRKSEDRILSMEGDMSSARLEGTSAAGDSGTWAISLDRCNAVPGGDMNCATLSGAKLTVRMAN